MPLMPPIPTERVSASAPFTYTGVTSALFFIRTSTESVGFIDTLKQELSGTKAYEQTSEKEKSVINY